MLRVTYRIITSRWYVDQLCWIQENTEENTELQENNLKLEITK